MIPRLAQLAGLVLAGSFLVACDSSSSQPGGAASRGAQPGASRVTSPRMADPLKELLETPSGTELSNLPLEVVTAGRWAAIRTGEGVVAVWDVPVKRRTALLSPGPETKVIALSPEGKTLASVSGDQGITLWDVATGQRTGRIAGDFDRVHFNHKGDRLVAGGSERMVVSDVRGERRTTLKAASLASSIPENEVEDKEPPRALGFAADDTTVVAEASNYWLTWTPGTPAKVRTIDYFARHAALSPDGARMVMISPLSAADVSGFVWDVASQRQTTTWQIAGGREALADVGFDATSAHVVLVKSVDKGNFPPDYTYGREEVVIEVYRSPAMTKVWSSSVERFSGAAVEPSTTFGTASADLFTVMAMGETLLVRTDGQQFSSLTGPAHARCAQNLVMDPRWSDTRPKLERFICRRGYAYALYTGPGMNVNGRQSVLFKWSYGRWSHVASGTTSHGVLTGGDLESVGLHGGHFATIFPEAGIVAR